MHFLHKISVYNCGVASAESTPATATATTPTTPTSSTSICSDRMSALKGVVKGYSFVVSDVPADGNCALHAVCDQLSMQEIVQDASSLQKNCVEFLVAHAELSDERFLEQRQYRNRQEYRMKQAVDGHWCDKIMLRSVASICGAEIHIVHDSGHITKINPSEFSSVKKADHPIYLGQIGELHYVSLRPAAAEYESSPADLDTEPPADVDATEGRPGKKKDAEELPDYLKPRSWSMWREKRPWLEIQNKKVFCRTCISGQQVLTVVVCDFVTVNTLTIHKYNRKDVPVV